MMTAITDNQAVQLNRSSSNTRFQMNSISAQQRDNQVRATR